MSDPDADGQGTYGIYVSQDMVEEIHRLLAVGDLSQREIGEKVGVSQTYVSQVKLGKVKWAMPSDSK